jgi:hypothetical protein
MSRRPWGSWRPLPLDLGPAVPQRLHEEDKDCNYTDAKPDVIHRVTRGDREVAKCLQKFVRGV